MDFLVAALYGIVEGITEWLPISSTGHLIILNNLVPLNVSSEFWEMFEVVIQLGAILAVFLLYFKNIWPLKFKESKHGKGKKLVFSKDILWLWLKIIIACIPAAIVGLKFDDFFEEHFHNPLSVAISLIVVGIIFIIVEVFKNRKNDTDKELKEDIKDIMIKDAIIIGIFQLIAAMFPGVSRSGATIIGGLLLGLSRSNAAQFTFYLGIPTMFGASLLKLYKFYKETGFTMTQSELIILVVGMIVSFVVSIGVIKMLMGYIKKHDFKVFGIYRIILGIAIIALLFTTNIFA